MIKVEKIYKSFGNLQVLKDINIEVEKGEIVSIVGPSGAGKTTLLMIMGTLEKADSGKIYIDKYELSRLSEKKLSDFRNKNIGFVFQFHQLLPEFTAIENCILPALIGGASKHDAINEAERILSFLNLSDRHNHKPSELSGGEKQRVAVARALINDPKVVFADEPSGNLDSKNQEYLMDLFVSLRNEFKQTFIIVTHAEHLSNKSDRTLHIVDGKIVDI